MPTNCKEYMGTHPNDAPWIGYYTIFIVFLSILCQSCIWSLEQGLPNGPERTDTENDLPEAHNPVQTMESVSNSAPVEKADAVVDLTEVVVDQEGEPPSSTQTEPPNASNEDSGHEATASSSSHRQRITECTILQLIQLYCIQRMGGLGAKLTVENERSKGSVIALLAISTLFVLLSLAQLSSGHKSVKAGYRVSADTRDPNHKGSSSFEAYCGLGMISLFIPWYRLCDALGR